MIGAKYEQETDSTLRTADTDEAMKNMDCSEMVSRVLAIDELTPSNFGMNTKAMRSFFGDTSTYEIDSKPQMGDIMLWETHVAIVANVSDDGQMMSIVHASSGNKMVIETKTLMISTIEAFVPNLIGYIRPIVEGYRGGPITPAIVTSE